jgi:hypothetical protein
VSTQGLVTRVVCVCVCVCVARGSEPLLLLRLPPSRAQALRAGPLWLPAPRRCCAAAAPRLAPLRCAARAAAAQLTSAARKASRLCEEDLPVAFSNAWGGGVACSASRVGV